MGLTSHDCFSMDPLCCRCGPVRMPHCRCLHASEEASHAWGQAHLTITAMLCCRHTLRLLDVVHVVDVLRQGLCSSSNAQQQPSAGDTTAQSSSSAGDRNVPAESTAWDARSPCIAELCREVGAVPHYRRVAARLATHAQESLAAAADVSVPPPCMPTWGMCHLSPEALTCKGTTKGLDCGEQSAYPRELYSHACRRSWAG